MEPRLGSDFAGWSRRTRDCLLHVDLEWCIWSSAPQTKRDKKTDEEEWAVGCWMVCPKTETGEVLVAFSSGM